ncbi:hypothetical protein DRN98_05855 [Methanosarcinales archaeon]|nr:MAG: hypothetical protein DRN98_05855 [Methanosarcinales archaeon]
MEEEGWDGSLGFVCACNTIAVTFGSLYVCKDGPVFSYARLKETRMHLRISFSAARKYGATTVL